MPRVPELFDFPDKQIRMLDEQGLVDIVHQLVRFEVSSLGVSAPDWSVSKNTKSGDGGLDGFVRWQDGLERTPNFPSRWVGFQIKAAKMGPAACRKEMLGSDGRLSPEVDALLRGGGTYVLVVHELVTPSNVKSWIRKMREAISEGSDIDASTAQLDVYDAERVAKWMQAYPAVVHEARSRLGLAVYPGLHSWQQWNRLLYDAPRLAAPETYEARLAALRFDLTHPSAIVRLMGQAGLGKTRLGMEATRPDSKESGGLSDSVMYVERGDLSRTNVIEIARALAGSGSDSLLIVDNCPSPTHDDLSQICRMPDSQFRLLTMDYDSRPLTTRATVVHELTPENQAPVVREMIVEGRDVARIADRDVDQAVRFAQGYPEIARLILDTWDNDGTVGSTLQGHDRLVERILFGRAVPDRASQDMLEAMAVFKYFGYRSSGPRMKPTGSVDPAEQYTFVAKQMCGGATRQQLRAATLVFEERGVLEPGGELMRVRPRPLALYLAARWWKRQHPDDIPHFLKAVEEVGLTEPLCQQMELLSEVEHAQEIAEQLCGSTGSFGQAETLSTATGARVLRALAVVHPSAALGALDRAFATMTTDELLAVDAGRRDLVNALETLAWGRDTFAGAARLLLHFAAAENERWANNATGQHRQLYRLSLSGTETPADERLPVLVEALGSPDAARRIAAVQGLGSALNTGYASRSVGSERAGGGLPRVEWQPQTFAQITAYLTRALQLLTGVAVETGKAGATARDELRQHLMWLWNRPAMVGLVTDAVREIVAAQPAFGEVALRELIRVLERSENAPPLEGADVLTSLRDELRPTDLAGRLRQIVMEPVFEETQRKTPGGNREDVGLARAEALADELTDADVDWKPLLDILNGAFGTYARAFGQRVGERCDPEFVGRMLDHLETAEESWWSFVGGVLLSRPEAEQDAARDRVASSSTLRRGYAALAAVIGVGDEAVLLSLFQEGALGGRALETVRHALQDLPDDGLDSFLRAIVEARPDLRGSVFDVAALWERPKALLRDLLSHEDTFKQAQASSQGYLWGRAALDALNDGDDRELAESLAWQVVAAADSGRGALDKSLEEVASVLLSDYRDVAWPIFREALEDPAQAYALTTVLGASYWGSAPLFESFPVKDLIAWARGVEHVPSTLARSAPVFAPTPPDEDGPAGRMGPPSSPAWHPATRELILAFGEDEAFLRSLSANLFSFSSSGSRIPYYEARQTLLRELLESPHASVREWARQQVAQYDAYIDGEVAEHEEDRLRYG